RPAPTVPCPSAVAKRSRGVGACLQAIDAAGTAPQGATGNAGSHRPAATTPLHHQRRAVGQAGDLVGDAAEEVALDIAEAAAAQHDEIDVLVAGERDDGARRRAALDEGAHV